MLAPIHLIATALLGRKASSLRTRQLPNRVGPRAAGTLAVLLLAAVGLAQPPSGQQPEDQQPAGVNLSVEGDFITFSVDEDEGLPLLEFIKLTERVTGKVFTFEAADLNAQGDTRISFIGTVRMRTDEFFGFFQTMLFIKNFALVPRGDGNIEMNQIVNLNNGRQATSSGAIYVPPDQIPLYARQTGVTVLTSLRLKHINAQSATNSLRPFFAGSTGAQNVVFGNVGDPQSLLITGFGPQVNSAYQLLQLVDQPTEEEDILIRVQPLIHAPAEEVQPVLESILTDRRRTTPATGASGAALANQEVEFKIEPLLSQNALILSGTADQITEAQDLIARLDKPAEASTSDIHVVPLRNVLAEDLEPILTQFLQSDEQAEQQAQAQAGGQGAQRRPRSVVIEAHPESNALLVSATTTRFKQVLDIIQILDQRQRQVLIEAAIVELTTDDNQSLGVELGFLDIAENGDFTRPFGFTSAGLSTFEDTDGDSLPDTRLPDFANPLQGLTGGVISGDDFAIPILLNAVATDNRANILSIPSVLVNNNGGATVSTLEIRPTVNNTQNNVGNQAGLGPSREAGITLNISPTISSNSFLRLQIFLDVSRFDGAFDPTSVTGGGIEIQRTVTTEVTMPSNDTMVLGGVIEDRESESETGVPILKDIPVLGYLFRTTTQSRTKVNLYFFVTPIILDEEDFSDLWEVTYRRKLDAEGYIGTDRLRIVDRRWRGMKSVNPTLEDSAATIEDLDAQGGNDMPFYMRRNSSAEPYVQGQGPTGPRMPSGMGGGGR